MRRTSGESKGRRESYRYRPFTLSSLLLLMGLVIGIVTYSAKLNFEDTTIVFIIVMMIVLAVSLYRWMKGQSIYWWTGHPDTSWEGASPVNFMR